MSLFMSEEESNRRLSDVRNVLQRVDRGGSALSAEDATTMPVIPSFSLDEMPNQTQEHETHEVNEPQKSHAAEDLDIDPTILLQLDQIIHGARGPGRKPGIRNRTIEENGSLGLSKLLLGRGAVQQMFGVDGQVAHNLTEGYQSSVTKHEGKSPKDELLDEVYRQGKDVQTRAFKKLLTSLDLIDSPEGPKLSDIKSPIQLTQVAKNLSGIIKDMTPKDTGLQEQSVHFHIYRPEQNTEDAYETLEVGKDGSVTNRS